ncbi:MAG: CgeB family protein [Thermoplasmata archaeon]
MRILIVGRKLNYNAEYFFEKAFRKLGHEVVLMNSYEGVKHHLLRRQIHARTRYVDFLLSNYWINRNLNRIVDSYDPDAIIFFKGEFISPSILREFHGVRRIYLYYTDTYKFKPLLKEKIHYYDAVFTAANNTEFYYNLGARRVVTIPWSCDPEFHRKIDLERKYEISFIGTAYLERRAIIRRVGGVDLFGDFWFGFGKRSHGPVFGEEFVRTVSQSAINLNLQARVSVEADAPTMRTFEVAGCGGFQISDYMPSIKKYLPMVPTFKDVKELKELISYYLENSDEREDIAERSMKTCYDSFKYTDAAKLIISSL